ncbi:hypothetical protein [Spirosoma montaniterrae]|uniref:hypothetical protein n=1 Tax=Spirosoma montaniterrae TaxID=1178516 RepID=UPI001E36E38D|nr:hypothetical protein [Spirosoma montaniterrae]
MRYLPIFFSLTVSCAMAQSNFVPNYDETKVGSYTLPNPLTDKKGQQITTAKAWQQRRADWLNLFAEHVYGKTPNQRVRLRFQPGAIDANARGGRAIRKQVSIYFADYPQLPPIDLLLYVPKTAKKAAPVFLGLNFCGNHCISNEPDIPLSTRWMSNAIGEVSVNNKATEKARGMQTRRWPIDTLLARGYAVATAYYGDIEPDHPQGWKTGIRSVLGDSSRTDNWGP